MTHLQEPDIQLFHASLLRATGNPQFFHAFYRRFMHSSEAIATLFRDKDMSRIEDKLKMTLEMVTNNADGRPGLGLYLEMLGRIHHRLHITPELFAQWRHALIDTASECDEQFDTATRMAWEQVIDNVIAKMHEMPDDT